MFAPANRNAVPAFCKVVPDRVICGKDPTDPDRCRPSPVLDTRRLAVM
jgi:hypothetical protein